MRGGRETDLRTQSTFPPGELHAMRSVTIPPTQFDRWSQLQLSWCRMTPERQDALVRVAYLMNLLSIDDANMVADLARELASGR